MRKLATLGILMLTATLSACGGGDDAFGTPGAGGVNPNVASISVSSSTASILNDGTQTATITAFVRAANNALLPNVTVTFSTSSGGITPGSATTDASGQVTATLSTAGDSTIRNITVTAAAGTFSATVPVAVVAAQPPAVVGTLTLTTSTPTIPSDNSLSATITAIVRDTQNRFLANIPVVFTSNGGGLAVTGTGATSANGQSTATLTTPGDPSNRTITVTATAQSISQTVTVAVTGTTLAVQGPTTIALNGVGTYTVTLADSAARGIVGRPLTVASTRLNTLSASALTTDSQGRATFTSTITQPGNDTLTVTGLGLTATQAVTVNADSFAFTTPAADNAEIPLSPTTQTFTVRWLTGGVPVPDGTIVTFSTTRGTLSSTSVGTVGGNATVTATSTNAGGASISATGTLAGNTVSAQRLVEFVAQTAASIDVQPGTFTVATNEQTTITAIVRDGANNLVKNKLVTFTLTDVSGGSLSLGSATTDSQGRAQTVYRAGSSTSAQNGVTVTGTVTEAGAPITDSVQLTVARKELFISIGTGNSIEEPNPAQYRIQFVIQVTDANGNGVSNASVNVSIVSIRYYKGRRAFAGSWVNYAGGAPIICSDEDVNRNGVLDTNPNEDFNGSGRLEAGNIALVTPNAVQTNSSGFAIVDVLYPQEYAYWLEVTLEARAGVAGTETARASSFLLPGSTADFSTLNVGPPGPTSPFGVNACNIAN